MTRKLMYQERTDERMNVLKEGQNIQNVDRISADRSKNR